MKFDNRISTALIPILLLLISVAGHAQPPAFPPPRPNPMPAFHVPRAGSPLDEGWQYTQTIVDADTGHPELFNAYPVQITFTHDGRDFIATLHTIFNSQDGGYTWHNLDPSPPPFGESTFNSLRVPVYISGLAARPVARTAITFDSLYISTFNANNNVGRVHLLYYTAPHYFLLSEIIHYFLGPHWLTGIALPDSDHALAFSGLDRLIYKRDSLSSPVITPWDSVYATQADHWVSGPVARVKRLMMAVGSEHWISRNAGTSWSTAAAADSQGDIGVSFADTLHGLTGGGTLNPSPSGWVHRTTDGGLTWSGSVLNSAYPIRCVDMVTPLIGFAAGGNYLTGHGVIWKTTDGGQTWNLDATMDAEITAIESELASGAYVNVSAAGVFPDFRGGVWRNQLYLPNLNGPVLTAEPDTLDFGMVARGDTGLANVTIQNGGLGDAVLTGTRSGNPAFAITNNVSGQLIAPGGQLQLQVIFVPPIIDTTTYAYAAVLSLVSADGHTDIIASGAVPLRSRERDPLLPQDVSLSVWPNPGTAIFQIRFELARASDATISIYDLTGREVSTLARGNQEAGEHVLSWNAGNSASGIYFVRLEIPGNQLMKKLLLVK